MRESGPAMMGRGRNDQGCYGSARQTLAASVPRLSVPPSPGIRPLGFHAGICRWATRGRGESKAEANGIDFVLGIAAAGEFEYSRACGQNRPPTHDVADRRQLLPASVRSHEKTANFASGRREPPLHAPHRARLGVLLSKALRGASRGGALGPRLRLFETVHPVRFVNRPQE